MSLPCEKRNLGSESKAPTYTVTDVFHRDVVDVVISGFQDPEIFPTLHLTPFKEYQELGDGIPPTRIYGELYSADAFYGAWEEIQKQPHVPGESIEHVVAALMLWSDSTSLTNFGNASLWPIYISLGNQSKYIRSKPSSFSNHHLAYLPSVSQSLQGLGFIAHYNLQLPDDIQDAYLAIFETAPSSAVLTHLKRELMHAVYGLILNSRFMEMYRDGILVTCYDKIPRRIFIRLLTYSGDYPEKYVISCDEMICTYIVSEFFFLASSFLGNFPARDALS